MSSIAEKVVIITGASSGIGEATAKQLARKGAKLMLAARREDRLADLVKSINAEGGKASFRVTDVTKRDQVNALAEQTVKEFGQIDVIINNAGLMPISRLAELKVDEWDRMIDVNIKGVLNGIAAVLPGMLARKSGHIINISSVAGHKVMAAGAVYCGTKFAVRAISEGLRMEVGKDIRSTIISPGAVMTELPNTISNPDVQKLVDGVYQAQAIDPSSIAGAIVFAMEQPEDVDVNEIVVRPTVQEF
jgi:NADP-dependent 3-hydroxy acid dehydrogenase YdfG